MDNWESIKKLSNQKLRSLTKNKPFLISEVNDQFIIVIPESTGLARSIEKEKIIAALRRLKTDRLIAQRTIDIEYTSNNSTYTLAILKEITGAVFYREGNAAFIKLL